MKRAIENLHIHAERNFASSSAIAGQAMWFLKI